MASKYIVFSGSDFLPEFLIVFPDFFDHTTIRDKWLGFEAISAGFVNNGKVYGYSQSLDLKCREKDQYLFDLLLGREH
jgi:hypothetical protein